MFIYYFRKKELLRCEEMISDEELKNRMYEDLIEGTADPEMVLNSCGEIHMTKSDIDYWFENRLGVPDPDPYQF